MPTLELKPIHKPVLRHCASRQFDELASEDLSHAEILKMLDCFAIEQAVAPLATYLNVAKACFHNHRNYASALQNELHPVMADGVSSIKTRAMQ